MERAPLLEGKSMHITVASVHKPKEHEATQRATTGGRGDATEVAAATGRPVAAGRPSRRRQPPSRAEPEPADRKPAPAAAARPAAAAAPGGPAEAASRRGQGDRQPGRSVDRPPKRDRQQRTDGASQAAQRPQQNERDVGATAPAATGE